MDVLSPCPLVTVPQSTKVGHYRTESSKSEKYRRIPFQNKKYIKMRQIAKLLERITFTSVLTNLGISSGHICPRGRQRVKRFNFCIPFGPSESM